MGFSSVSAIKNPPAMQEMSVQSLGKKDSLEEGWLLTPVFLSGEFHGQGSLEGYSPLGCKESGTTERTEHAYTRVCKNLYNFICKCFIFIYKSILCYSLILSMFYHILMFLELERMPFPLFY